ncbi:hypothetical protein AGLY_009215 [Aphis glycines]|uniref:ATP-grasp domain-containing protein n=1 Tax=Aphis glycines TaxID=307491 RepID=A0A6G0TJY4_APHGL|nr:hypothetical protein AGLY_009215 [Aphis glycines]
MTYGLHRRSYALYVAHTSISVSISIPLGHDREGVFYDRANQENCTKTMWQIFFSVIPDSLLKVLVPLLSIRIRSSKNHNKKKKKLENKTCANNERIADCCSLDRIQDDNSGSQTVVRIPLVVRERLHGGTLISYNIYPPPAWNLKPTLLIDLSVWSTCVYDKNSHLSDLQATVYYYLVSTSFRPYPVTLKVIDKSFKQYYNIIPKISPDSIGIYSKTTRDTICHKGLYWDSVRMQPKKGMVDLHSDNIELYCLKEIYRCVQKIAYSLCINVIILGSNFRYWVLEVNSLASPIDFAGPALYNILNELSMTTESSLFTLLVRFRYLPQATVFLESDVDFTLMTNFCRK